MPLAAAAVLFKGDSPMTLTKMYRAHRDRHIAYGWRPLSFRHWLDKWGRHVKNPQSFNPYR